ncbi:MAG: hypothetical protein A2283_13705 [Lentisphaerae bacterium RIFOXYA12_FULL_48_11]|nr:MAG: hypothetical protein A2283_13705 [Lentisphaerae bacterium RIFOXYA12_FULL_48_11]
MRYTGKVVLTGNNEPFMHPLLVDFCRMISDRLPFARCHFTTNGSLITREQVRELCELSHPPAVDINDYTPQHVVIPRIRSLLSSLSKSNRLTVVMRERSRDEYLGNRAGNQSGESNPEDYRNVICTWPFMGLFVSWDLKVFQCCSDYLHEVVVGDLSKQSLMDIWKGQECREIREKMLTSKRRNLVLCRKCDSDWFILPDHCAS